MKQRKTVCELFSVDDQLIWAKVVQTVEPIGKRRRLLCGQVCSQSMEESSKVRATTVLEESCLTVSEEGVVSREKKKQSWPNYSDDIHVYHRMACRFQRGGRLQIEGQLDLHGLSQTYAHAALRRFVDVAWQSGLRLVLIITGKGNHANGGVGILRSAVPLWLNEPDLRIKVLSFTYAKPRDGGDGALYLLIRRQRINRITKKDEDSTLHAKSNIHHT